MCVHRDKCIKLLCGLCIYMYVLAAIVVHLVVGFQTCTCLENLTSQFLQSVIEAGLACLYLSVHVLGRQIERLHDSYLKGNYGPPIW